MNTAYPGSLTLHRKQFLNQSVHIEHTPHRSVAYCSSRVIGTRRHFSLKTNTSYFCLARLIQLFSHSCANSSHG